MTSRIAKLSLCTLNQWALDFEGNYQRISRSIKLSHEQGARYRLGAELEICGYGCEDHFYEEDTQLHSWQVLAKLLVMEETQEMICDVGMPVEYEGTRYNCRIIFTYKHIILIRPKLACCNQGNYRELRWFTPWLKKKVTEEFLLPPIVSKVNDSPTVPIGDGIIQLKDTCIASEICEELWTANSTHVEQSLAGAEIITNASASHFNLRKLNERLQLVKSATSKVGGVYLYNNLIGCDGGRIYFDGASNVCVNGQLVKQNCQFSLREVDVMMVTVDLNDVRAYRGENSSRAISSSSSTAPYPKIKFLEFGLCMPHKQALVTPIDRPIPKPDLLSAEEEIEYGPACWLWDYLRRSRSGGFFLPLSGGIDSSSVACIVYSMCCMVHKEVADGNEQVFADVCKIVEDSNFEMETPEKLCKLILTTCYMATENSSTETRGRADQLAARMNSSHYCFNFDSIVKAFLTLFTFVTKWTPKFRVNGGSVRENLALQNIQARSRMILAYLFAQLLPCVRGKERSLLVLGSSNVDECLRGYYTKYDCSSADLNPIGGINKGDLKGFISHFIGKHEFHNELNSIVSAPPTAELEPLDNKGELKQTDEEDMGMSYSDLTVYGKLRKLSKCGPYSMFCKLCSVWTYLSPREVGSKVRFFFQKYAINRHKTTTLTPSLHAENYGPDDNRFDLRPFLYPNWSWQFNKIEEDIEELERLDE